MLVDQLVAATAPWAELYGNNPVLQNAVAFGHLGGMVLSGGLALATDRFVVSKRRVTIEERRRHLAAAPAIHGWVILGLGLTMVSGMLMLAADLEYLIAARAFWIKMGLVALLLTNGFLIKRQENILNKTHPKISRHWRRLRHLSAMSLTLWFAVVLAGVTMGNI